MVFLMLIGSQLSFNKCDHYTVQKKVLGGVVWLRQLALLILCAIHFRNTKYNWAKSVSYDPLWEFFLLFLLISFKSLNTKMMNLLSTCLYQPSMFLYKKNVKNGHLKFELYLWGYTYDTYIRRSQSIVNKFFIHQYVLNDNNNSILTAFWLNHMLCYQRF